MAEGDGALYNSYRANIDTGTYEWVSNTLIATLHTGYTPNIDTDTWAGISSTQYSTGGGYTVDNKTLSGKTRTQDNTNNKGVLDCDDIIWTSLTLSPNTPDVLVIRESVSDALICYITLGTTATNGTNYVVSIAAAGLINI